MKGWKLGGNSVYEILDRISDEIQLPEAMGERLLGMLQSTW